MSTNQFRRYLDLLNEDPELSNPTQSGSEPRCAMCGTPQSQHQALKHPFVAGGAEDRPESVAQGGGGGVGRIKKLQAELKAAGANLGSTGANRDGIDGDIGPLTTTAMADYPNIAAKYPDLKGAAVAQAATPAVDTSKLTAALSAIESIVAKYKGKINVSESRIYEVTPTDFKPRITVKPGETQDDAVKRSRAEAASFDQIAGQLKSRASPETSSTGGTTQQTAKGLTHTAGRNNPAAGASSSSASSSSSPAVKYNVPTGGIPSVNSNLPQPTVAPKTSTQTVQSKPSSRTSDFGKKILAKLPGLGARTASRAGAAALSGPAAAIVGTLGALYTVWDVGNMLYDAFKDSNNIQGISDADQAVIKQNLAAVNSFMKDPKVADTLPQDIKTRVENVMADLVKLSVDTGSATPAATQQVATPATTPATGFANTSGGAAVGNPTQAQQAAAAAETTMSPAVRLDKLLKKYNFESREYLTPGEQLAYYRDIVNEADSIKKTLARSALAAIKPIVRRTVQGVGYGAAATGAIALGLPTWKLIKWYWDFNFAPPQMSETDKAEFKRIMADFNRKVPDKAAWDALPPSEQDEYAAVLARIKKMEEQGK
jgi:hypothetical protein